MKYFGFTLIITSIIISAALSGSFMDFVDIPSLFIVFSMSFGMLLFRYGNEALRFWEKVEMIKALGNFSLHSGLFATLMSLIIMAMNLTNPKHFGIALAVAIMPLFYSYLIYFFTTSKYCSKP